MLKSQTRSGFTLVEMLIVMATIGVLAAMVILSQQGSRAKARDAIRVKDFDEFATALYLYYDSYGVYPCGDSVSIDGNTGKIVQADSSNSCPFLQGIDGNTSGEGGEPVNTPICTSPHGGNFNISPMGPNSYTGCKAPLFGLQGGSRGSVIYNKIWQRDPLHLMPGHTYMYTVSEDRKKYLLQTTLETNPDTMTNDDGLCSLRYEVGPGKGDPSLTYPSYLNLGTFGPGVSCNSVSN